MQDKQPETVANTEEELKRLREKTDKDELMDLKRGLMGGYRQRDVEQYVERIKEQLQTAEKTYKSRIAELAKEKETLKAERDNLMGCVAMYESATSEQADPAAAEQSVDEKALLARACAMNAELIEAKSNIEVALSEKQALEEKLAALSSLADDSLSEQQGRAEALERALAEARDGLDAMAAEKETLTAERDAMVSQNAQLAAAAGEAEELRQRSAEAQDALDAMAAEKETLIAERDAMASQAAQLAAAASEAEELRQRSAEAEDALTQERQRAACLEESLVAQQQQYASLEDTLAGQRQQATALEAALADETRRSAGLEGSLRLERENVGGLKSDLEALTQQLTQGSAELEETRAELRERMEAAETAAAATEEHIAELEGNLEVAARKLERKDMESRDMKAQLADTRQENCRLNSQIEALGKENAVMAAQVAAARDNILRVIADKEAIEQFNDQLREALNSLVVKADSVIKENAVLTSQLDGERERVQQYQALHDRMVDLLARVRTANQLLDERLMEMDKSLSYSSGQMAKPAGSLRRNTRAELLDFSDGKSAALHDIINELNSIQTNLAQYQQPPKPRPEPDKKPNIRYSVEKLELDVPADKPKQDDIDELLAPGSLDFNIKTRK